jgi:hypothetical protein
LVKFEKSQADKAIKRKSNDDYAIFKLVNASKKIKEEERITGSKIWQTYYLDELNSSWVKNI